MPMTAYPGQRCSRIS